MDFEALVSIFRKWLYINDEDFIKTVIAASCDRRLSGDPIWLMVISPPGGMKTETLRSLSKLEDIYQLDSLTRHTLISGKVEETPEGGKVVIRGLFEQLDKKILIIKDGTLILSKDPHERAEIFGQLRTAYDGYLIFGFGTLPDPIKAYAKMGLIFAVTPVIDMYNTVNTMLGERFLRIRHRPSLKETAEQAMKNTGTEERMREELSNAVCEFLKDKRFHHFELTYTLKKYIIELAIATAVMRTPVTMSFYKGGISNANVAETEVPTRLAKQLWKMLELIACLNDDDHDCITKENLKLLQRIARDTCEPGRVKVIQALLDDPMQQTMRGLETKTGIPYATVWRVLQQLKLLKLVDLVEVKNAEGEIETSDYIISNSGTNCNKDILKSMFVSDIGFEDPLKIHNLYKAKFSLDPLYSISETNIQDLGLEGVEWVDIWLIAIETQQDVECEKIAKEDEEYCKRNHIYIPSPWDEYADEQGRTVFCFEHDDEDWWDWQIVEQDGKKFFVPVVDKVKARTEFERLRKKYWDEWDVVEKEIEAKQPQDFVQGGLKQKDGTLRWIRMQKERYEQARGFGDLGDIEENRYNRNWHLTKQLNVQDS